MATKKDVPTWVDTSVAEPTIDGKNPAAVALGRLGGKKGGPARAKALTPERRQEIAKKAIEARWMARRPTASRTSEDD